MNIFVIGLSSAGKTPFIQLLNERLTKYDNLAIHQVYAGQWVFEELGYPSSTRREDLDPAVYPEISRFVKEAISKDPYRSLNALKEIKSRIALVPNKVNIFVWDGIRNPVDYFGLCDPVSDIRIFLRCYKDKNLLVTKKSDTFEQNGIEAISVLSSFQAQYWGKMNIARHLIRVRDYPNHWLKTDFDFLDEINWQFASE